LNIGSIYPALLNVNHHPKARFAAEKDMILFASKSAFLRSGGPPDFFRFAGILKS
jgi:hypothetical protein